MGNRMLKESIRMSEQINDLSWFEEAMFYRLIVTVDDYGIYPANPVTLTHILFPMKSDVEFGMVKDALVHFIELDLIDVYSVEGKGVFLKLVTWASHQRLHESKHKFPVLEDGKIINDEILSGEFPQFSANVGKDKKSPGKNRLKPSRNQVETKGNSTSCPEQSEICSVPPVIEIILNDGSMYGVTNEEVEKFTKLYPAVNVMQELRGMAGWCDSNPTKRKTKNGIRKFINSWLARAQDKGGSGFGRNGNGSSGNPFLDMIKG